MGFGEVELSNAVPARYSDASRTLSMGSGLAQIRILSRLSEKAGLLIYLYDKPEQAPGFKLALVQPLTDT